jgi:hypothetical protein
MSAGFFCRGEPADLGADQSARPRLPIHTRMNEVVARIRALDLAGKKSISRSY